MGRVEYRLNQRKKTVKLACNIFPLRHKFLLKATVFFRGQNGDGELPDLDGQKVGSEVCLFVLYADFLSDLFSVSLNCCTTHIQ